MIRGTTPTLEFTLPFDADLLNCMYVTISQDGKTVLEKCLTDCHCNGPVVTCKLTQADTLSLKAGVRTEIQVRGKTADGNALASRIMSVSADRILKDGEI